MNTDSDAPRECKYWIRCSVNHCPLDSERGNRPNNATDKQRVCLVKNNEARAKRLALKHLVDCPESVEIHAFTGGQLTGGIG